MNCLVLADTFPSRHEPWRGPYNRRQMECLAAHCHLTVIAPMPWPCLLASRSARALTRSVDTVLEGIPIHHPPFYYVPLFGRNATWRGILAAAQRTLRRMDAPRFDVILATFAYPHGLAARSLARELGIPYVIKARGSDLHALPASGPRRDLAAEAVRHGDAIVAVSRTLADIALALGAPAEKVHVLHNGIDLEQFGIRERSESRQALGLPPQGPVALFVGNLLPVKGLDILLQALSRVKTGTLYIAGEGPLRGTLQGQAANLSLGKRVRFLGPVGRADLVTWINAADVLVLPSRNEGCPNVVLEAMACGTPVVASRVGAVPDLLHADCGRAVDPRDPEALAEALQEAWTRPWDRAAIRRRVDGLSWERNAERLFNILRAVTTSRKDGA